jgi:hypothetical protein
MFSRHSRQSRPSHVFADELEREFDETYQTIMSGKGVRTDEEELALVSELIRRAEQGSYPEDGAMHIISPRADVDWASDAAMRAVQSTPARNYGLVAGGLLIGVAVLVALFSVAGGNKSSTTSPISAMSMTATALAASSTSGVLSVSATQTAMSQATAVWAGLGISGIAGIVVGTDYKQKLPPVYPETLEIDGVPFRVYPSAMDAGKWQYELVEGTASWIGGTLINWSFGVPDVKNNLALFQRLQEAREGDGDKEALVRLSGGVVRHFRLQKPTQVERQQIEVFAQNQPGITIILLGDEQGPRRWLLRGREDYALIGYGTGADLDVMPVPTMARPRP